MGVTAGDGDPPEATSPRPQPTEGERPGLQYVRPIVKSDAPPHPKLDLEGVPGPTAPCTKVAFDAAEAFIAEHLLSVEECRDLCLAAEAMGYSFWSPDPQQRDFRNADTVEVVHPRLAALIWGRLQSLVPPVIHLVPGDDRCETGAEGEWVATGCGEHLLFARYRPAGHFSPHTDGYTVVDFNCRSLYSVVVYLTDCAVGGGTALLRCREGYLRDADGRYRWPADSVVDRAPCRAGSALVFFQDLPHEGEPVGEGGTKVVLRMDVMYERRPRVCDGPHDREGYRLYKEAELLEADGNATEAALLFRRDRKSVV